jgi:hypothetical protein
VYPFNEPGQPIVLHDGLVGGLAPDDTLELPRFRGHGGYAAGAADVCCCLLLTGGW